MNIKLVIDLIWLLLFGFGIFLSKKASAISRAHLFDHKKRMQLHILATALVFLPTLLHFVIIRLFFS